MADSRSLQATYMASDYRVEVVEDVDTGLFVTSATNIPGLVAEAETYDKLVSKVGQIASFLLHEIRGERPRSAPLEIDFVRHDARSFTI